MKVLIVEAELTVAAAMACALEARGHEVVIARSVQLALSLPRPEVLVADADIEGLSGIDLLEQYQRTGTVPRSIFVTTTPDLELCHRALQLGDAEFLARPFRLEDLVRAVEACVSAPSGAAHDSIYPASPAGIEAALRDLAAFAVRQGIGPACRARACTATGELVQNTVDHAFVAGEGSFRISASLEHRDLVVRVCDEGAGFDADRSRLEALADGGGLRRAAALAEDIDLRSRPGAGTTCTLRFSAGRVDFEDCDRIDLGDLDYLTPETAREVLATLELAGEASLFQLSPAMAVVIGRLLAGPDPSRLAAQALRS